MPTRTDRSTAPGLRRRELLPRLALALGGLLASLALGGCPRRGPSSRPPPRRSGGSMYRTY